MFSESSDEDLDDMAIGPSASDSEVRQHCKIPKILNTRIFAVITLKRSVRVAERLALPTSVHGVTGSNPVGGEILLEPKRHFIAQSLSCSPFHRLEMTEILLKGRKTRNSSIITLKVEQDGFSLRVMHPKGAEGIANRLDPNQTAPGGAV